MGMGEDFTLLFHFGNFEIHRKLTIKRDREERIVGIIHKGRKNTQT